MDTNGRVYAWGLSAYGQCAILAHETQWISRPTLIEQFKNQKVERIACGQFHSFVRTQNGHNYLFGRNEDRECIGDENKEIQTPHRIDKIVNEQLNNQVASIIDVYPGMYTTAIICEMKETYQPNK